MKFEPSTHTYTENGIEVPSVTRIIGGKFWGGEFHRDRGSAVHKTAFLWIMGSLEMSSIDSAVQPFLDEFGRFILDTGFEPDVTKCEWPMMNRKLWFAGTPDFPGNMNGRPVLVELKTCGEGNAAIQTAAYVHLEGMDPDTERFVLTIPGKYRLKPLKDPADWPKFLKLLNDFKKGDENG